MSSFTRNQDRPVMILLDDEWAEGFSCMLCGNTAHSAGFYPCDEEGKTCEPDLAWAGIWRCDGCGQRYWPKGEKGAETHCPKCGTDYTELTPVCKECIDEKIITSKNT